MQVIAEREPAAIAYPNHRIRIDVRADPWQDGTLGQMHVVGLPAVPVRRHDVETAARPANAQAAMRDHTGRGCVNLMDPAVVDARMPVRIATGYGLSVELNALPELLRDRRGAVTRIPQPRR